MNIERLCDKCNQRPGMVHWHTGAFYCQECFDAAVERDKKIREERIVEEKKKDGDWF